MAFKVVSNKEIQRRYQKFLLDGIVDESLLDPNYKEIRIFCLERYNYISKKAGENAKYLKSTKHFIDMEFGMELYDYLNKHKDFNAMYRADYSFWKYLAVFVIPDIVSNRWGADKEDHFDGHTKIYPFQIYWYIHLSWQGDRESTRDILKNNQEDQILQLVDRPGTIGVNVELYREIMKRTALIPISDKQKKFRAVMLKNTSKMVNLRPELFPNGIIGYVDMLFSNI